ncbi:MAG: hypothetical protein Q9172_003691 [Xanthocarpia lactea]
MAQHGVQVTYPEKRASYHAMQYAKYFIPLESDPSIFTSLLHDLGGARTLEFIDIWSLDDPDQLAVIHQPVLAFVLVLPTSKDYEKLKAEQRARQSDYVDNLDSINVLWFKQTIHNACGLYGLLHAICNAQLQEAIKSESLLDKLLQSANQNPAEGTHFLENSKQLEETYAAAANQGSSSAPNAEDKVDFHYVCFVKGKDGQFLYELDGDLKGPVRRGPLATREADSLFEAGLNAVREPDTYPPLNHSVDSLSILRLLPGSSGLSRQLESTSFGEYPRYRAFSYEWGSGNRTLPILINGVETRVGKNLWEALYHLRDPRRERVLWVDAIYVNQHDLAEKAIVVPRMNLIYRRAAEVIMWLGPHPPPKIVNLDRIAWRTFAPPSIDKAYRQEWWHQAVPWLFDLMHTNYWTRTWIIQEVGEAVRLTVQFGKQSMPWEAFVAAVATYRKCFPRAFWTDRVSALEGLRRSKREGEIYSFTDLISVFRNSFCKVPHDKIYAFLGMAADDSPNFIPAAYNKTLAQVHKDVMRFLGTATSDRAVKEVELVHLRAPVRRLLTRRTGKPVAVDEKPTSILRQAEPHTYYDDSAPDKGGKTHLKARTAYHKQWYEWAPHLGTSMAVKLNHLPPLQQLPPKPLQSLALHLRTHADTQAPTPPPNALLSPVPGMRRSPYQSFQEHTHRATDT